MIQIGKQIEKVLRQRLELDHDKLAELAHIGLERLNKIIHHNAQPSIAELERIADSLGVKPSFLVEEDDAPTVESSLDDELVNLLSNPMLAVSLWRLSQLPVEDQQMISKLIMRFGESGAAA